MPASKRTIKEVSWKGLEDQDSFRTQTSIGSEFLGY